ncbi:hypothetical protein MCERE155_01028 [Candidatus Nanopelagicaceae bacterium]
MNRIFISLFIGFGLLANSPIAAADDMPMLTWETGKEQNVKMSGDAALQNWDLEFHSKSGDINKFHKSEPNAKGERVYSISISNKYPSGLYTIQTTPTSSNPARVISGVNLIPQQVSNVVQIPWKLIFLLLTVVFFFSTLSCIRMEKYERIEYLRPIPSAKLPNLIAACFRFRVEAIEGIRRSLFKFLLIREGELLFRASPAAWALLPMFSFGMGCLATLRIQDKVSGAEHINLVIFVAIAVIGLIDPYSGFMSTIGFSFVQTVMGRVTTVEGSMVMAAIGLCWIGPGIIASLYQNALRKDRFPFRMGSFLPELFASILGGLFYAISDFLLMSLADQSGPVNGHTLKYPFLIGVAIFIRMSYEKYSLRDLHMRGKNYQVRVLKLPRVVSVKSAGIVALFFSGILFVWTQMIIFSLTMGIVFSIPLFLLTIRFDFPKIALLQRYERNILLESTLLCLLTALVMIKISNSPYDVLDKGKLLITDTGVAISVHAFLSLIFDSSSREKVSS